MAVTVIIPTYNRASLFPAAVESAKRAGSHVQVIVVDDASTDNTAQVCASLSEVYYLRLPRNEGLAAARNAGILASQTELVAFLDDDDLRLPGSLDSQISELEASPDAAFCYGRLFVANSSNALTGDVIPKQCAAGDIFWELLEQNFVGPSSVVARKHVMIECNLFNAELRQVEDWDLWLRVTEKWPVVTVQEPVAIYRKANSTSNQICSDSVSIYRQMLKIQELALQLPRAAAAPGWKRRRARSRLLSLAYNAMVHEAETALVEGDPATARAKSHEALRLRPLRARTDLNLLRLLRAA